MKITVRNRATRLKAVILIGLGLAIAAIGISVANQAVVATAPLFPQSKEVPSVVESAPAPRYTAAVERARELARAAVLEQNLPGVSVAVGAGGTVVWAEGFGWRDVGTKTPVTPATRFNIGTAASAVTASVAPLGLKNTGADAAKEWSPEAIGEDGEDFPPLTFLRHMVWQPLGLMPSEYPLPGDRATFYIPKADNDPRHGRRLMYMRDLACCADGKSFYSTPSDLVRFALATKPGSLNGELAGGLVMSLTTGRDGSGVVIAVTSNMSHANTSALARRVGDAFAEQTRQSR